MTSGKPPTPRPAEQEEGTGKTSESGLNNNGGPSEIQPSSEQERMNSKRMRSRALGLFLLSAAIITGLIVAFRYWRFYITHVSTDDAYLTTDVVQITPQVSGSIYKIFVSDNEHVHAGQLIATIDNSTFQALVDQAKANVAVAEAGSKGALNNVLLTNQTTRAQIAQAEAGVAQGKTGILASEADAVRDNAAVSLTESQDTSARELVKSKRATMISAQSAIRSAQQMAVEAQSKLVSSESNLESARAAEVAARAEANRSLADSRRYNLLFEQDAVSAQTRDAADAAAIADNAKLKSSQEEVKMAQAMITQQRAALNSALQGVIAAKAGLTEARAAYNTAEAGVQSAHDQIIQAKAVYQASLQNTAGSKAKANQLNSLLSIAKTAPTQIAVQNANAGTTNARVQQAKAALQEAVINLKHTYIYAPVSGHISAKTVQLGQQVAVGQSLMTIIPDNKIWVVANFKETILNDIKTGEPADIYIDTFGGRLFHGYVQSISAATGSTFSLLPPDNATGNFTKVVQRVPVRIFFDSKQSDLDHLRGGLSATVDIKIK